MEMATYAKYEPQLQIVSDADDLAHHCLELFRNAVISSVQRRGLCRVAISGGNSPRHFFEFLGDMEESKELPWDKVHLFWVDERYVDENSPYSNFKLAKDTFLQKVNIPLENIHPIPTESPDAITAARMYEKTIRKDFHIEAGRFPQFDLIVLGMGPDGHTGSLFSDSYACFCTDDIVSVVYALDEKLNRVTLTGPVLTAAKKIVVLVTGKDKSEILRDVLTSEPDQVRFPIHLLWPVLDKVTWLVDKDAAILLKK